MGAGIHPMPIILTIELCNQYNCRRLIEFNEFKEKKQAKREVEKPKSDW